jgi:peptidyl-prolyl cis-trans isomerase SDCCAG10
MMVDKEPPTDGRVILHTNYGPIEISLWANETPRASRNFV